MWKNECKKGDGGKEGRKGVGLSNKKRKNTSKVVIIVDEMEMRE